METVHYYLALYGHLGIFLWLALGIFGPPVADELLLLFLGYLAVKGEIGMIPTVAVVLAGIVSGFSLDYWLARTLGHYLLHRPNSWLHRKYQRIDQLRQWLERSGGWAFIGSYFVPGWRHCVPLVAGLSRLDFPRFAAFTFAGGLLWSLSYIVLGYLLGDAGSGALPQMHHWFIAGGFALSAGLAYKLWRKRTACRFDKGL